jgi:hypothetical protein
MLLVWLFLHVIRSISLVLNKKKSNIKTRDQLINSKLEITIFGISNTLSLFLFFVSCKH